MLPGANIQAAIARLRQSQAKPGMGMPGQPEMDQIGGGMPPQGMDPAMSPMAPMAPPPMPMNIWNSGGMGDQLNGNLPGAGFGGPAQIGGFGPAGGQAPVAVGEPAVGGMGGRMHFSPNPGMSGMSMPGGNMAPQVGGMQAGGQREVKGPVPAVTRPAVRQPRPAPGPATKAPAIKPGVAAQARRVGGLVNQIADFKPQTPGGSELTKPAAAPEAATPKPGSAEERRTAARNIAAARPKTR